MQDHQHDPVLVLAPSDVPAPTGNLRQRHPPGSRTSAPASPSKAATSAVSPRPSSRSSRYVDEGKYHLADNAVEETSLADATTAATLDAVRNTLSYIINQPRTAARTGLKLKYLGSSPVARIPVAPMGKGWFGRADWVNPVKWVFRPLTSWLRDPGEGRDHDAFMILRSFALLGISPKQLQELYQDIFPAEEATHITPLEAASLITALNKTESFTKEQLKIVHQNLGKGSLTYSQLEQLYTGIRELKDKGEFNVTYLCALHNRLVDKSNQTAQKKIQLGQFIFRTHQLFEQVSYNPAGSEQTKELSALKRVIERFARNNGFEKKLGSLFNFVKVGRAFATHQKPEFQNFIAELEAPGSGFDPVTGKINEAKKAGGSPGGVDVKEALLPTSKKILAEDTPSAKLLRSQFSDTVFYEWYESYRRHKNLLVHLGEMDTRFTNYTTRATDAKDFGPEEKHWAQLDSEYKVAGGFETQYQQYRLHPPVPPKKHKSWELIKREEAAEKGLLSEAEAKIYQRELAAYKEKQLAWDEYEIFAAKLRKDPQWHIILDSRFAMKHPQAPLEKETNPEFSRTYGWAPFSHTQIVENANRRYWKLAFDIISYALSIAIAIGEGLAAASFAMVWLSWGAILAGSVVGIPALIVNFFLFRGDSFDTMKDFKWYWRRFFVDDNGMPLKLLSAKGIAAIVFSVFSLGAGAAFGFISLSASIKVLLGFGLAASAVTPLGWIIAITSMLALSAVFYSYFVKFIVNDGLSKIAKYFKENFKDVYNDITISPLRKAWRIFCNSLFLLSGIGLAVTVLASVYGLGIHHAAERFGTTAAYVIIFGVSSIVNGFFYVSNVFKTTNLLKTIFTFPGEMWDSLKNWYHQYKHDGQENVFRQTTSRFTTGLNVGLTACVAINGAAQGKGGSLCEKGHEYASAVWGDGALPDEVVETLAATGMGAASSLGNATACKSNTHFADSLAVEMVEMKSSESKAQDSDDAPLIYPGEEEEEKQADLAVDKGQSAKTVRISQYAANLKALTLPSDVDMKAYYLRDDLKSEEKKGMGNELDHEGGGLQPSSSMSSADGKMPRSASQKVVATFFRSASMSRHGKEREVIETEMKERGNQPGIFKATRLESMVHPANDVTITTREAAAPIAVF